MDAVLDRRASSLMPALSNLLALGGVDLRDKIGRKRREAFGVEHFRRWVVRHEQNSSCREQPSLQLVGQCNRPETILRADHEPGELSRLYPG